jgi:hypothetical protein
MQFTAACWASREQTFSTASPTGLMATYYCIDLEIPAIWRARFPYSFHQGTGQPSCIPRYCVLFNVRSYFTTGSQSVSMPRCRGPLWGLRPDIAHRCCSSSAGSVDCCSSCLVTATVYRILPSNGLHGCRCVASRVHVTTYLLQAFRTNSLCMSYIPS